MLCLSVDWRHVCGSTDVMFVDWHHYKDWAVCVMKLFVDWRHVCQLMKLQIGTPGHKWRPGHRDTGNINHDREPQREITDWDTGTQITTKTQGIQMTTGTQGHNYNGDAGGTGKVDKWRPGHRDCSKRNYRPGHREYKWRVPVSRSVILSVDKHDVSRQTTSWRHNAQSL